MDNQVTRTVEAPTEAEARLMAEPMLDAFRGAGWELREALWIPGDRRPGLGESLLLSPESQVLLEGDGTLRLSFANADQFAVAPAAVAAPRQPDVFEDIGGVRYRRLIPRWGLGIVAAIVFLLLFIAMSDSMSSPRPVDGICPVGWVPGLQDDGSGGLVPDGTCVRLGFGG